MTKKKLGIIGGMGPWATAYTFNEIVRLTKAETDADHIHILIDNNTTIPDRTKAICGDGKSPIAEIANSLKVMQKWGADLVIIPCNTTHYYFEEIQSLTDIKILNIIEITAAACKKKYGRACCGILATKGTIITNLYQEELTSKDIPYVTPKSENIKHIMQFIYDYVKGNKTPDDGLSIIKPVLDEMVLRGAEYFVLGCTELSVLTGLKINNVYSFVDSSLELVKAAITECGYFVREIH